MRLYAAECRNRRGDGPNALAHAPSIDFVYHRIAVRLGVPVVGMVEADKGKPAEFVMNRDVLRGPGEFQLVRVVNEKGKIAAVNLTLV